MNHDQLFKRACAKIPGGVNSPVRAFGSVGGTPVYVASGTGSTITTCDGRTLTDFCCSWGAMILGHAHPEVVEAIQRQAEKGTTFGINTEIEVQLAERLCELVPCLERVRLVNSGTEAVMTALRVARGATGRNKIVKFDGCYHGHSDSVLVSAGSGLLTGGITSTPGVPQVVANDTFVVQYNDLIALTELMREKGSEVAAIIVEPVVGNMGLVQPTEGFLKGLRLLADKSGAVLIFDEVITGFRFGLSSYSQMCGVTPDLITLGKVIGGGLPLAAVGGKASLMDQLAPSGKIYQAGTLSGNPLAVAAGLKTLEVLQRDNPYPRMAALGKRLSDAINPMAKGFHCAQFQGIFTMFFTPAPVTTLAHAKRSDTQAYATYFHKVLGSGFYMPPAQFEVAFISAAHTESNIDAFTNMVLRS
ncbi:MAG: glutamate-1-semialdehyde 2,1-aminomutase [bacterium]